MKYDIAIIGGGPAGYTAAERAAAGGLKTVIFEKKAMGGVCLNEGCIPTKTLLYSAKLLDNAKGAAKYGIAVPDGISFNLEKIIDRKDKVVKKLTGGVKQTVKSYGAELIEKEAVITGEDNGLIQILAGGEKYEVTYLLVCTGSDTVIPPIKGLSEIDYWTSKEALEMAALPKSLAIIGGGVIGMEFASFFNSMGVKVSVIEMMPEILGAMDKETSAMLRTEYQKRGINFQLNSKVIEVSPAGVTIEKAGKLSLIVHGRHPHHVQPDLHGMWKLTAKPRVSRTRHAGFLSGTPPVFHNPSGNFLQRRTISRFMPCSRPSAERSYMWKIWASCQWVWLQ